MLTHELTPRERQIIALIASGLTDREISHKLGSSFYTVRTHAQAILAKMHARTRAEAVANWLRSEW